MECIVKPLNVNELPVYEALGRSIFPEADWDTGMHRVRGMMELWPHGIWSVWKGESLQACMTLWPIDKEAARALEAGEIGDDDINSQLFPEDLRAPLPFWIITAAWVLPKERGLHRQAFQLLTKQLITHLQEREATFVYAHAITEAGRKICLAMGFRFSFPAAPLLCKLTYEAMVPKPD